MKDRLQEWLENHGDPKGFELMCKLLLQKEVPDYQDNDDSFGDDGADGFSLQKSTVYAIWCPKKFEDFDSKARDKIRVDTAKLSRLRQKMGHNFTKWVFLSPRNLSNNRIRYLRDKARSQTAQGRSWGQTKIVSMLLSHAEVKEAFIPWAEHRGWSGRTERIRRQLADSRARCFASWQTFGIPTPICESLFLDESVGQVSEGIARDLERNRLLSIGGEMGSGKTLVLERLVQWSCNQALGYADASVPVYLEAQDALRAGLKNAVINEVGTELVAEELGFVLALDLPASISAGEVEALLAEARVLINRYDKARVCIAGQLPGDSSGIPSIPVDLLDVGDALTLVRRTLGDLSGDLMVSIESVLRILDIRIQEVIRRPLYALCLSKYLRRHAEQPVISQAQLLDAAVAPLRKLEKKQITLRALMRLSQHVETGPSDWVPSNEFKTSMVETLLATGLVREQNQRLSFTLPVLGHWYAARSLCESAEPFWAHNLRVPHRLTESIKLALQNSTFEESVEFFAPLIEKWPGLASRIATISLQPTDWANELSGREETCANRFLRTIDSFVNVFPGLSQYLYPHHNGRRIPPIVWTDSRYFGADFLYRDWGGDHQRDFLLRKETQWVRRADYTGHQKLMGKVGTLPNWWWLRGRDFVKEQLKRLFKQRAFRSKIVSRQTVPMSPRNLSDDEIVTFTRTVILEALQIYRDLVETHFPSFRKELKLYSTQPLHRTLILHREDSRSEIWHCTYDQPPRTSHNTIDVTVKPKEIQIEQPTDEQLQKFAVSYHAAYPTWFRFTYSYGPLRIWKPGSSERLAYKWLEEELKEFKWLD